MTKRRTKKSVAVFGAGFTLSLVVYEYFGERLSGSFSQAPERVLAQQEPHSFLRARSNSQVVESVGKPSLSSMYPSRLSDSGMQNSAQEELVDWDPALFKRAEEITAWHVGRQFLVPVMSRRYHFQQSKQAVTAEERCSVSASQAKDLLASLALKDSSHVRPQGGEILSYYRYFIFEGKYYFLRGNRFGDENGLRLDLRVSDTIVQGNERWDPVVLPVYRGELLTDEKFYQVIEVLEDDFVARGAVLASRSLVKRVKQVNAPEAEPAVVGLYNGEIASLTMGGLDCRLVPSKKAPLHCSCPK